MRPDPSSLEGLPFFDQPGNPSGEATNPPELEMAVRCQSHPIGRSQLVLAACGREQTGITHQFTARVGQHEGLNIEGMTTSRIGGAAGSYMVVSHLTGDPKPLSALHRDITANPWLYPHGRRVLAATFGDLSIVAADRPRLLRDCTEVVSQEFGVNIETLVNRTYSDMHEALLTLQLLGGQSNGGELAEFATLTGMVSVTRMKLEFPTGVDPEELVKALKARIPEVVVKWQRRHMTADSKLTRKLFGSQN